MSISRHDIDMTQISRTTNVEVLDNLTDSTVTDGRQPNRLGFELLVEHTSLGVETKPTCLTHNQ